MNIGRILAIALLSAAIAGPQNAAIFPGAAPTPAQLGVAANHIETTLTMGIGPTDTSIPVLSSSGFTAGFFAAIDGEILSVCSIPDGNRLRIGVSSCPNVDGRGTDTANGGGAANSHIANAAVEARIVAWQFNQPDAAANAPASRPILLTVDVRQPPFNAKCDGATDDRAAFQAAHDSLSSLGGVLMVPGGVTCLIGPPGVKVNKVHVSLASETADPEYSTIIQSPSGQHNYALFHATAAGFSTRGVHMIGDGTLANPYSGNATVDGVFLDGILQADGDNYFFQTDFQQLRSAIHSTVKNVKVYNDVFVACNQGWLLDNSSDGDTRGYVFTDNRCHGMWKGSACLNIIGLPCRPWWTATTWTRSLAAWSRARSRPEKSRTTSQITRPEIRSAW